MRWLAAQKPERQRVLAILSSQNFPNFTDWPHSIRALNFNLK
jgi:hypothetical protein